MSTRITVQGDACDLVDQWADDFWRTFEDALPFGVGGPGRDVWDAGELARIDLRDRLTAQEAAA